MLAEVVAGHLFEQEEMVRVMSLERAAPAGERCPLAVRGEWDPLRISAWVTRELSNGDIASLLAALTQHEDAIGRYPSARAALWLHAGIACERAGQFEAAVAAYARGREQGSRQLDQVYWLHNNAGYSLNQLGRHEEALSLLAVAVDEAPLPHNAWKNLGVAWQGLGRLEAAAVAYARAFTTTPEDRRALALLEDLLLANQDRKLHELPELEGLRSFVQGLVDESRVDDSR
jgi:tetratricopeptide (TPR) repeat protein